MLSAWGRTAKSLPKSMTTRVEPILHRATKWLLLNCVKTLEKLENTTACRFGTQCGLLADDHWSYKIDSQGRNDSQESSLFVGNEAKILPILEPIVIKPSTLSLEGWQESCLHAILPQERCLHTSIPHVRRVSSRCRSKTLRRITFNANDQALQSGGRWILIAEI